MSARERRAALDEARSELEQVPYAELRERLESGHPGSRRRGAHAKPWRLTQRGPSGNEYEVLVQASWWDKERGCIIVITQIGWATVSSFVRCPEGVTKREPPRTGRDVIRKIFRGR